MKKKIVLIFMLLSKLMFSQMLNYSPEIVIGHRSYTYQHMINLPLGEKLSLSNLTYFDSEYKNNSNNLYIIRNNLSYDIAKNIKLNAMVGIKNPGTFSVLALQYSVKGKNLTYVTYAGWHYQKGSALEYFTLLQYDTPITQDYILTIKGQNTFDINHQGIFRGVQQLRIGLSKGSIGFGIAGGFDQWKKGDPTLYNLGIYFRYSKSNK